MKHKSNRQEEFLVRKAKNVEVGEKNNLLNTFTNRLQNITARMLEKISGNDQRA